MAVEVASGWRKLFRSLAAWPVGTNKKRPKLFSSGRLGSPPPELPNHDWIVGVPSLGVNVTSVTSSFSGNPLNCIEVTGLEMELRWKLF